jgi:hypothetical protein
MPRSSAPPATAELAREARGPPSVPRACILAAAAHRRSSAPAARQRAGAGGQRLGARLAGPDRTLSGRADDALGTDGFGRSDTRAALRRFFEIDRQHVVLAALQAVAPQRVPEATLRYGLDADAPPPWTR